MSLPSLGGNEFTATISADSIPASQWVTVEVPVTADPLFDVAQVMMTPIVPGSEGSGPWGTPIPVQTDSMYLDNVYFSNGNDVPEPAFEAPDALDITFTPDEMEGFEITSFGAATAEVKPHRTVTTRSRSSSRTGATDLGRCVDVVPRGRGSGQPGHGRAPRRGPERLRTGGG